MKENLHFADQLSALFLLSIEGTITEDQFAKLSHILKTNAAARDCYYNFIVSYISFDQLGMLSDTASEVWLGQQAWEELLEYEQTAPPIMHRKQVLQQTLIQKVVYPPREKRKISKLVLFPLINVAAIFLFIVFFSLTLPKSGTEVATLPDSLNAKWLSATDAIQQGKRFAVNTHPFLLKEGLVILEFDNTASIAIEEPGN